MTHRERLLTALEHRRPDRVPMDIGTARFTGMVKPAYDNLRAFLGFGEEGRLVDRMQQLVEMDEAVLRHLDVDARAVSQGAPDRGGEQELSPEEYKDEWGVTRAKPPGCHYYELTLAPLAGNIDAQAIARYRFPDPADPGRARGLREAVLRLRQSTDYAIIYNARYNLVHQTQYLRGFEDWYCDLGDNHALFTCLFDAVAENMLATNALILPQIGDLIDIVAFGDDVGLEDRPVCSPAMYRKLIRPYQEKFVQQIRSLTGAKILYHSCGSVYRLIGDFIELGIDALNPIQVTAKNMEPERLNREFGGRIAFWGGVDSRTVLPHGSPEEVRAETRRMFAVMGEGGGYVLGSVHNIQPDVPPQNVLAMFAEGRNCVYPVPSMTATSRWLEVSR